MFEIWKCNVKFTALKLVVAVFAYFLWVGESDPTSVVLLKLSFTMALAVVLVMFSFRFYTPFNYKPTEAEISIRPYVMVGVSHCVATGSSFLFAALPYITTNPPERLSGAVALALIVIFFAAMTAVCAKGDWSYESREDTIWSYFLCALPEIGVLSGGAVLALREGAREARKS